MDSNQGNNIAIAVLSVFVGVQFIIAATFSVLNWSDTVAFNAILVGTEWSNFASLFAVGFGALGGLSLLLRMKTRIGAVCLLLFLIPASARHLMAARDVDALAASLQTSGLQAEAVDQLENLARRGQLANVAKNFGLIGVALFGLLGGLESSRISHSESEETSGH